MGSLIFLGEDAGGNPTTYARIQGRLVSPTAGSEDGQLEFQTTLNAAETTAMIINENQDVHIGGTAPSSRLHITDNARDSLTLEDTATSLLPGPIIDLYRNSASPAVNDVLGQLSFNGEDSAGAKVLYGDMYCQILDETAGTEDAQFVFQTMVNGTIAAATRLTIAAGVVVGAATGGDQGVNTINASTYYSNGTVGVDFGPAAPSSITVKKGIVTAAS
jgi:hypothetical protein